jgi:hypothetical protein
VSRLRRFGAVVGDLVRLRTRGHHAAAAGAAVAIASDLIGTKDVAKVAIGLIVTVAVREVDERAGSGKRRECERRVAEAARNVLDAPINLTRIDQMMILGRSLTLRRIGELAGEGRTNDVVGFGGPAHSLATVLWAFVSSFETEIGRCHSRLRPRAQDRVDAFVQALRLVAGSADAMLHVPPYDPATAPEDVRRLYDALTKSLIAAVLAADAVDRDLDRAGADLARQERDAIRRAHLEGESAAVAVLVQNARAMVAAASAIDLDRQSVEDASAALGRAREIGLHVDGKAFFDAPEAARGLVRTITHDILAQAIAASADPTERRRLLAMLPAQLATLEGLRQQ